MKDHPILFSAPMIRALLEGRKTQTRRVVKGRGARGVPEYYGGRGEENDPREWGWFFDGPDHYGYEVIAPGFNERHDNGRVSMPCPYGKPGDLLWVRETTHLRPLPHLLTGEPLSAKHDCGAYSADNSEVLNPDGFDIAWWYSRAVCPPIHMPRWASRITLRITEVRVQRLQDISETDAASEGVERDSDGWFDYVRPGAQCCMSALGSFITLWESINNPGSWNANPWVWALTFEVVNANIDQVRRELAA